MQRSFCVSTSPVASARKCGRNRFLQQKKHCSNIPMNRHQTTVWWWLILKNHSKMIMKVLMPFLSTKLYFLETRLNKRFLIWSHLTFLQDLLDPPTKISSLCLISDQKWATNLFPLLHLPFGTLSINILVPQIHNLLSEVYSRPSYIKSLFQHSYQ